MASCSDLSVRNRRSHPYLSVMGWFTNWLATERAVRRLLGPQRLRVTLRSLWTAALSGPPGRRWLRALGRWRCLLCGEPLPDEGLDGHDWCSRADATVDA